MGHFLSYELLPVVFNMTVTASVVILAVLLVRFLLKKLGAPAVVSYALWAVVLFRLLCPVSFSAPFSLLGVLDSPAVTTESGASTIEYVPREIVHMEYPAVELPIPVVDDAINAVLPQGEEQLVADPLEAPVAILTMIWLCGLLVLILYSIVSYLRLRMRLLGAIPLEDNIMLADHIASPFVMGLFRPKIYLPSNLSEAEREYIILHERHHIRRLDHIVKILAFVALCIHWFNPLVWLAFYLSGRDMEMSCDEAVVKKLGEGIRADYSASLLKLSTGRTVIAATPLAFGEGDTKGRIRNLAKWKKPAVYITVVAVILCAVVIVLCATNAKDLGQLKVSAESTSAHDVSISGRLGNATKDWAIYEDIYRGNQRISSKAILINGEHPKAADTAKKLDYVFKVNMTSADGGGFAGPLRLDVVDGNGTVTSREAELPYETYGAFMMCAGDREAFPGKWNLSSNDEKILFSVALSLDDKTTVNVKEGVVGHNDTVVQYRLVTSDTVRDWTETPEQPPRKYGPDKPYVSEKCLYMAPYSSYYPAGGNSGYRYWMGDSGVYKVNRNNGEKTVLAEGSDWEQWNDLPWSMEEWEDLFWPEGSDKVLLSGAIERKYCPLSERAFLLRVDGVLWLVELWGNLQKDPLIHSIYTLVPEGTKGGAQWEFAPMLSAREPYFRFKFDMEYDEISAACAETPLMDVDGEKASDHALMFPVGHAVYWSPGEGAFPVFQSEILFTVHKDGQRVCSGTVYIQGTRIEESGTMLYTATLVGTGLVMEQNPDGGAIIRLR